MNLDTVQMRAQETQMGLNRGPERTEGRGMSGPTVDLNEAVAKHEEEFGDLRHQIVELFEGAQASLLVVPDGPAMSVPPPPPPPAHRAGPPPPPPVAPSKVFTELNHSEAPLEGDPIQAFAPPPRMDWGPAKGGVLSRLRSRTSA